MDVGEIGELDQSQGAESSSFADARSRPDSWRNALLDSVLRFAFWLGLVIYVPSAWAAIRFGELGVLIADTLAVVLLGIISRSGYLPRGVRSLIFCAVMYGLGCLLMMRVGSVSQIYLFAASIFATIFVGRAVGLWGVLLNCATMLMIGYWGFASPEMLRKGVASFESWAVMTLSFVFINTVVVLAVAAVISVLQRALLRSKSAQHKLKLESQRLIVANEELRSRDEMLENSRKMDAVGQLAGGIAHDFNNMLSVILGHSEIVQSQLPQDSQLQENVDEVLKAAERSAALTRQLLAFARKQTASPVSLDLNRSIQGMLSMLRRLIGENIELVFHPSAQSSWIRIDPNQVDQVLANLVVNARDAIAGVGTVTVAIEGSTLDEETAGRLGLKPGDHVVLRVLDDGMGMDDETRTRLYEPFFTTKGVGQGTGLGLSTVYGIVQQNEGGIQVTSQPGQGTTFEIFFPRSEAPETVETAYDEPEVPRGRGELILLVEDERAVLELGAQMLSQLGYRVHKASTAAEALKFAGRPERIDLLISDVIMPQMNGLEVVRRASELQPGIASLYVSGYSANVISERGILPSGTDFLAKPFSKQELAAHVRRILERSPE